MTPPFDFALDASTSASAENAFGGSLADTARTTAPSGLTLAAVVERHQAQLPIVDAMIDDALRTLRAAEALLD